MAATNSNTHNSKSSQTQSDQEQSLVKLVINFPKTIGHIFQKKPLIGIAGALITILVLLLTAQALLPREYQKPELNIPESKPSSSPQLILREVSETAKGETFIRLEEELVAIQKEIENLDLLESKLSLPILDLSVTFDL